MTTLADIQAFRVEIETLRTAPVHVSKYITVDYTPLPEMPQINLDFVVGGGWNCHTDYRIVGGPDAGKRVELLYWKPRWAVSGIADYYNGTPEEAEAAYGYTARPAIRFCGTLHAVTVAYLMGHLAEERSHAVAREIGRLYEELERQSA